MLYKLKVNLYFIKMIINTCSMYFEKALKYFT